MPRKVLEAIAIEGYRCGDFSLGEVAEILELSINEADGFLKQRGVFAMRDLSEINADSATLGTFVNQ